MSAETEDRLDYLLRGAVQAARDERDPARAVERIFAAIGELVALADGLMEDGRERPAAAVRKGEPSSGGEPVRPADARPIRETARRTYRARRLRDEIFADETLFGEPAWDILLEAVSAEIAGQPTSIGSVCAAAAVPPTTALRWLVSLEKKGLLLRVDDPEDRRRTFVRPTQLAMDTMRVYFERLAKLR